MSLIAKRVFRCRIEELPAIGTFEFEALVRDALDFKPYTDFNAAFATAYQTNLNLIRELVNPVKFTLEMKVVTLRMYTGINGLRGQMNVLQNYVNNAGKALSILPDDFGISQARRKIANKDAEGLDGALKLVESNIADNLDALKEKGYTDALFTKLQNAHAAIFADNNLQNKKTDDRDKLVADNMQVMNDFYTNYVSKVANQGKLIFKASDASKVDDYSISALMRRIRQEQLKTSVSGSIMYADGSPVNKVKIVLRPIGGGRSKTLYSKADGSYDAKGMRPGSYNMFVSKYAFSKIIQVDVVTGKGVQVDVTF